MSEQGVDGTQRVDAVASADSSDWAELARTAAGHESDAPEILRELLSFRLAGSSYAIPVERVREIVRMKEITPLPRVPESVLGVIELRGEVVQVVDLRMRVDLPLSESTRKTRVVVLHGDDEQVSGVLVDEVDQVLRVSEESVVASGGNGGLVIDMCVRGREFVSILDIDRVLDLDAE